MDKDLIGKYLSIASIAAIVCFAFGIYITNTSLKAYHIVDFDLLQPRAILVGFAFIAFIAFHVFAFLILIKIPFQNNSLGRVLLVTVIKVVYLATAFTLIFHSDSVKNLNLFGWELSDGVAGVLISLFMYFPVAGFYSHNERRVGKRDLSDKLFLAHVLFCAVGALIYFLAICSSTEFLTMLRYEGYFGFFFFSFVIGAISRSVGKERKNGDIFYFEDGTGDTFKKNFYNVLFGFMLIGMAFVYMTHYTKHIYFYVPQSAGGGKLEQMTYITESDTIAGKKIYETENYIFMENPDSSITKLDWADVTKVIYK